jgi:hypothetical protein
MTKLRVGEVKAKVMRCNGSLEPANAAMFSQRRSFLYLQPQ